ncbi:MAG: Ig-like domain-containing protein [Lachnotalea sp.]
MKKIKTIMALLVITLCMSIIIPDIVPSTNAISTVNAATKITLNSTKLTMVKKDSYSLKITGTKRKANWTSINKSVVTVSKNGKVKARGNGKATIIAKVGKKKFKCEVEVTTKKKIDAKLSKIYTWTCSDIWNNGFCNIYHYIEDGNGYSGQQINIDKTISKLNSALKKKSSYNKYVNSLTNKKYIKYIKSWNIINSEVDIPHKIIKETKPVASSNSYFPSEKLGAEIWTLFSLVY